VAVRLYEARRAVPGRVRHAETLIAWLRDRNRRPDDAMAGRCAGSFSGHDPVAEGQTNRPGVPPAALRRGDPLRVELVGQAAEREPRLRREGLDALYEGQPLGVQAPLPVLVHPLDHAARAELAPLRLDVGEGLPRRLADHVARELAPDAQ